MIAVQTIEERKSLRLLKGLVFKRDYNVIIDDRNVPVAYSDLKKCVIIQNAENTKVLLDRIDEIFKEVLPVEDESGALDYVIRDDIEQIVFKITTANKKNRLLISDSLKDYGFLENKTLILSENENDYVASYLKIKPETICNQNYLYCSGCGCCSNICPSGAISIKELGGFYRPSLDLGKCINCNLCIERCPGLNTKYENEKPVCYAVKAKNEIVQKSSSGGMFTLLAEYVLNKNGVVVGAAWDSKHNAILKMVDNPEGLDQLRHSKYLQSNAVDIFKQVRKVIKKQLVLFTGLPCQVAGLKAFLGKEYPNLITVDLLCHGGTTPSGFKKYLKEVTNKSVKSVDFRVVKGNTWIHNIEVDGQVIACDESDDYEQVFHKGFGFHEVCKACKYSKIPRQGDFTIGDFWRIENLVKDWDSIGTSLVLLNNEKAVKIFDDVKGESERFVRVDDYLKAGNRIDCNDSYNVINSRSFIKSITQRSFHKSVESVIKNRHDIGLVGININNFGTELTYYALYKLLNNLGFTVTFIVDRDAENEIKFENFINPPYDYYDLSCHNGIKEINDLNNLCDQFVLGSDQLFNRSYVINRKFYTCLDWVNSTKKIIGYATSFGNEQIPKENTYRSKLGYLLTRFDFISSREKQGVEILKNEFGIDSKLVLDPVFLISPNEYVEQFGLKVDIVPDSCFSYILDQTDERANAITELVQKAKMTNNIIFDKGKESKTKLWDEEDIIQNAFVEDWLDQFINSEYIITDSFHGLCFSLLFNKQFIIIFEDWQTRGKSRHTSLLKLLGLEERLVKIQDIDKSLTILKKPIDYEIVNKILEKEKNESINWLKNALKQRKEHAQFKHYDYVRTDYIALLDELTELESKVDAMAFHIGLMNAGNKKTNETIIKKAKKIKNLNEYLYNINAASNYYLLVSICDESHTYWPKVNKLLFAREPKMSAIKKKQSYAAIVDLENKTVIQETNTISNSKVEKNIGDNKITVRSNTFSDLRSIFTINGVDYDFKNRGINIALVSKADFRIVDVINSNIHKDKKLRIEHLY